MSRVDLVELGERIEAAERGRIALARVPMMVDRNTEARLLVAMICDAGVLELCSDVEVEDFGDLRHRAVMTSIRALQVDGEQVSLLSIVDEVEWRDEQHDSNLRGYVSVVYLGNLVLDHGPFPSMALVDLAARWLRKLAKRRSSL